jgi:hypothetical protein
MIVNEIFFLQPLLPYCSFFLLSVCLSVCLSVLSIFYVASDVLSLIYSLIGINLVGTRTSLKHRKAKMAITITSLNTPEIRKTQRYTSLQAHMYTIVGLENLIVISVITSNSIDVNRFDILIQIVKQILVLSLGFELLINVLRTAQCILSLIL